MNLPMLQPSFPAPQKISFYRWNGSPEIDRKISVNKAEIFLPIYMLGHNTNHTSHERTSMSFLKKLFAGYQSAASFEKLAKALDKAVCSDNLEDARALLKENPNLVNNTIGSYRHQTPLDRAVYCRCNRVAEFLLTLGADVNVKDDDGFTPLHSVASVRLAKMLLARGANVNARSKK